MSGNAFAGGPVLVDVSLDAARCQQRRLASDGAVAGVYRLPGQVAAGLDPDMVGCLAEVTICSFIARLACALTHPAGTAVLADRT
jgi:hypothetical protein